MLEDTGAKPASVYNTAINLLLVAQTPSYRFRTLLCLDVEAAKADALSTQQLWHPSFG